MPIISFDLTQEHADRLAAAIGAKLNLGRPANGAEVKQFTIDRWREVTHRHERRTLEPSNIDAL